MLGVVDELGNADTGHVFGGIGTEQGFQKLGFKTILQPPLVMFRAEDDGHPVVDGGDHRIGFGSDDRKRLNDV